jgi:uncharacterized membrane protein YbaN (DUF454 family)
MAQLPTHLYFGNSTEEFYSHETISAPMKLLLSLSSSIQCHISIFNAHKTLMKPPLRVLQYTSHRSKQAI